MEEDLAATLKREQSAEAAFQKLQTTKNAGLEATRQLLHETTDQLSSLTMKRGRLEDELQADKLSMAEDTMFKKQLEQSCQELMKEYQARAMQRDEELHSAHEAIDILSSDMSAGAEQASFLQLGTRKK